MTSFNRIKRFSLFKIYHIKFQLTYNPFLDKYLLFVISESCHKVESLGLTSLINQTSQQFFTYKDNYRDMLRLSSKNTVIVIETNNGCI